MLNPNPITQTMGITNNIKTVKSLMSMIKTANDPTAMLNHLAQNNPQLKEIMNLVQSGKSPKDLFYEKAKEMGVNPEEILQYLK